MRLRSLGLIDDERFLDELVIEAGDPIGSQKESLVGKPFRELVEVVKKELERTLSIPQSTQLAVKFTENDKQIELKCLPPIGVQLISFGITIKKTEDNEPS